VTGLFLFLLLFWPQEVIHPQDAVWDAHCVGQESWSGCFGKFILDNPVDHREQYYLKRDGGILSELDRDKAKKHLLTTI